MLQEVANMMVIGIDLSGPVNTNDTILPVKASKGAQDNFTIDSTQESIHTFPRKISES